MNIARLPKTSQNCKKIYKVVQTLYKSYAKLYKTVPNSTKRYNPRRHFSKINKTLHNSIQLYQNCSSKLYTKTTQLYTTLQHDTQCSKLVDKNFYTTLHKLHKTTQLHTTSLRYAKLYTSFFFTKFYKTLQNLTKPDNNPSQLHKT